MWSLITPSSSTKSSPIANLLILLNLLWAFACLWRNLIFLSPCSIHKHLDFYPHEISSAFATSSSSFLMDILSASHSACCSIDIIFLLWPNSSSFAKALFFLSSNFPKVSLFHFIKSSFNNFNFFARITSAYPSTS